MALQQIVDTTINSKHQDCSEAKLEFPTDFLLDHTYGVPPAQLGTIHYDVSTRYEREKLSRGMFKVDVPFNCGQECSLCCSPLGVDSRETAKIESCGHLIHMDCALNSQNWPTSYLCCQQAIDVPPALGSMPSGSMEVTRDCCLTCAGHPWGTLKIQYIFPKGTQSGFHPNPGASYEGTSRIAYLPDTSEGRILLSRLQESFRLGLNFNIGVSVSSRKPNVITWSSIPHKSNLRNGRFAFGYPDSDYFADCHAALDALHVRPASSDALLRNVE